jgi:hypothetical protein
MIQYLADNLETGQYKYLVIDTILPIEQVLISHVESSSAFGPVKHAAYGSKEVKTIRPFYINFFELLAERGIEWIIVTAHLKQPWEGKQPVIGAVKPQGRQFIFSTLSSLMLWLVKDQQSKTGAPAALVMKERFPGAFRVVNGRLAPSKNLPERIPDFSWERFFNYIENEPADYENPAPGEKMTPDEVRMLSDVMDDAQMQLMIIGSNLMSMQEEMEDSPFDGVDLDGVEPGDSVDTIMEKTGLNRPKAIKLSRTMEG